MARNTDAAVREILAPGGDYDLRRNPTLRPFIASASRIVDRLVAKANVRTDVDHVEAADAALVELWLAAHLYKMSDRQFSNKSTLGASASYAGKTGMGLDSTTYGQVAKNMDPSGLLATVMKEGAEEPGGFWAGTDQIDGSPMAT